MEEKIKQLFNNEAMTEDALNSLCDIYGTEAVAEAYLRLVRSKDLNAKN